MTQVLEAPPVKLGPARKRVLNSLPVSGTGSYSIGIVAGLHGLSYSSARTHLKALLNAGLVQVFRAPSGKFSYNRIATAI